MTERQAEGTIQRIEMIENILWNGDEAPKLDLLVKTLNDEEKAIRADVLDYLIFKSECDRRLMSEVSCRLRKEDSFPCLCRLIVISVIWNIRDDSLVNIRLPSLFDVLYLQVWMALAMIIKTGSRESIMFLRRFAKSDDTEISELARNLLINLKNLRKLELR